MTKSSLIIVWYIICGFTSTSDIQNRENQQSNNDLKGKVKNCIEITYRVFNSPTGERTKLFINKIKTAYNYHGDKTSISYLDKNGMLLNKITYNYDSNGKRINTDDSNGLLGSKKTISHDEKGNKIEILSFNSGNTIIKKFNQFGLLKEDVMNNANKKIISRSIYEYDEKKNKISEENYNAENKLIQKISMKYDGLNNNIEVEYHKSDTLLTKINNVFNSENLLIERDTYNNRTRISHKWKFYYTQIDKNDNWTKSLDVYDDKPANMKEREIEYYGD